MFQVPSVPSMGRSAHPTSPWRHLEISFFAGHWSISFQCFGASIATRPENVQQVSNWWGTSQELWQQLVSIRRSCWGAVWFQQILPESLKKLSYTWAVEKRQLACFFKTFWKEVPQSWGTVQKCVDLWVQFAAKTSNGKFQTSRSDRKAPHTSRFGSQVRKEGREGWRGPGPAWPRKSKW